MNDLRGLSRPETTKMLGEILELNKLSGMGCYWAKEVALGPRESFPNRVDYLQYVPESQKSIYGLEHGYFVGWEIKSCKADIFSGHGLNRECDKNYIVMPPWVWSELNSDIQVGRKFYDIARDFGVYVPEFSAFNPQAGEAPTTFAGYEPRDFKLVNVRQASVDKTIRKISTLELLFYMLRAGH